MIRRTIAAAALAALSPHYGCAGDQRSQPRALVRDTVGVELVSTANPKWASAREWRLSDEPTVRIELRGGAVEESPLDPVSVFRTDRGEYVVADGNQAGWHRLLVYSGQGSFLRHLGRKGSGPCEFQQVWQAWPFRGDSVAVFDMASDQVVLMSLAGGCGRAVRLPRGDLTLSQRRRGGFVPFAVGPYPDGTMLMAAPGYIADTVATGVLWYESELQRIDRSGNLIKSLGVFPIGQTFRDMNGHGALGFGRLAVRAMDGFDLLYGDGGTFELLRIDTTGKVRQIIRREYELQRVTRRDQETILTQRVLAGGEHAPARPNTRPPNLDQRIADTHWPEYKPAYVSLLVDSEGNAWVQHYRIASPDLELTDTSSATWSVFARAGEWLGDVQVPARLFVTSIQRDAVLGIWQDEDGARSVRAYALRKP